MTTHLRDRQASYPHSAAGETLVGREAETERLIRILSRIKSRNREHVWIHGPPGTGKTSVALVAVAELERQSDIRWVYVNCWESRTFYAVIARIIREFRLLHTDRTSTVHKLEILEKNLAGKPLVIVLDEIDKAAPRERDALIYNLCNLPTVALVCICNSRTFYLELDERVKSRMKPAVLAFKPHSKEILKRILENIGTFPKDLPKKELIEEIIGASGGDLRIAFGMLRELSSSDGGARPGSADLLSLAAQSAATERAEHVLAKLTHHHSIIHGIVLERGEIQAPELRRRYEERCRFAGLLPVATRTFNHYLLRMKELRLLKDTRIAGQRGTLRAFRVRH